MLIPTEVWLSPRAQRDFARAAREVGSTGDFDFAYEEEGALWLVTDLPPGTRTDDGEPADRLLYRVGPAAWARLGPVPSRAS